MKSDIHPSYHLIKVVMTDGDGIPTPARPMARRARRFNLDIDPKTHPAWTGGSQQLAGPRRPSVEELCSLEELALRIEILRAEIARLELTRQSKEATRAGAEALFKF